MRHIPGDIAKGLLCGLHKFQTCCNCKIGWARMPAHYIVFSNQCQKQVIEKIFKEIKNFKNFDTIQMLFYAET
jgi:hypothetical protein